VAVPLANPANVRPLLTLACGLAGSHEAEIVAFCVVKDRVQSELGGERSPVAQARQRLALATETARRWETAIRTELVVHRDVAEAILAKNREMGANLLVMGWRGGVPRRAGFASEALDRVVEEAECDVAILKPAPRVTTFRRILVAALPGAHAELAGRVGASLAGRFGAELHQMELTRVGLEGEGRSAGVSVVRAAAEASRDSPCVVHADSTPEGILGAARGFDLVVVGARRRLSQQLLYGTRLDAIARRANASLLIVRERKHRERLEQDGQDR
jgi:nucleotide-binding universal stress UspA family protein